jgi:hypothetical protein
MATPAELEKAAHDIGYAIGLITGMADSGNQTSRQEDCMDEVVEGLRRVLELLKRDTRS